ncbi:hypothetical protein L1987_04165 [Smallanthus sonchifolius]|uniref:Uncharacterized protein n=1 Tax=Smallanthus sonchifolius TaxID=185202 RepID=A0ACB9KCU6_9ASTR|nr:hypothetical protein L1987_04165 [Smallanthus sonchifolius]
MEDYMLQEDDDDNKNNNNNDSISKVKNQNQNENQHRVVVNLKRGRRWNSTDSTRLLTSSGSGMRAVFLNRPGSKTGTGVFLPPPANYPTAQSRKISGCSAALVPTRVLEALQQHFNNLGSLSPLNRLLHTGPTHHGQSGMQQKSWWRSTSIDHVKKKLPQEWTY